MLLFEFSLSGLLTSLFSIQSVIGTSSVPEILIFSLFADFCSRSSSWQMSTTIYFRVNRQNFKESSTRSCLFLVLTDCKDCNKVVPLNPFFVE